MSQDFERAPRRAFYSDALRFPGFEFSPNRCQNLQPFGFCQDNGHVALGRPNCETRRCPAHWRGWMENAAVSAVSRLAAFRHRADGWGKRLVHAAVSPPQNQDYDAPTFWEARSEAVDVAKEAGIRGGWLVAHPYRASDAGDELFAEAVEAGEWEESRGKYALFREVVDEWEEMDEYVESAPHFHVLGLSEDVSGDAAPGDWVVHNIRSLSRFEIDEEDGYRDMASVAVYALTHAAVPWLGAEQKFGDDASSHDVTDRSTVSWFGSIHGSQFVPSRELEPREWRRIQQRSEWVVKHAEEFEEGGEIEEWYEDRECPRDGCSSVVRPIENLSYAMANAEWVASLDEEERRILWGLQMWLDGDRPPPSAHRSERAMLDHLEEKGRVSTHITTHQAFIGAFE